MSDDDIESSITNFAAGYCDKTIKVFVDGKRNAVSSYRMLSGITTDDTEDDVGKKLYGDLRSMSDSVGDHFTSAVENNYDLRSFKNRQVEERANIDEEICNLEALNDPGIIAPDKTIFDMRVDVNMRKFKIHQGEMMEQAIEEFEARTANDPRDAAEIEREKQALIAALERSHERNYEVERISLKEEAEEKFIEAYDKYQDILKQRHHSAATIRRKKIEQEKIVVLELILQQFLDVSDQICGKIQDAVVNHPNLKSKLKLQVEMSTTGEVISNPFDSLSLPGMLQTLSDLYHKNTFVNFTLSLMKAMSWRLSENQTMFDPSAGVEAVQKMKNDWDRKNMWDMMKSPDFFWTGILLMGLNSKVKFRKEVVSDTLKFIKNVQEAGAMSSTRSLAGLQTDQCPIFSFVCKYIRDEQENRKLSPKQEQQTRNINGNKKPSADGLELEDAKSGEIVEDLDPTPRFDGEVKRSAGIKVRSPNNSTRIFPYMAVKKLVSVCSKCFPETGKSVPCNGGSRTCFRGSCNSCKYYGHSQATCLQTHDVDGKVVVRA